MKKLIAILLSAFLLVAGVGLFAGCEGFSGLLQVSVLQYAEHGSLDNCYNGIVEGLAERGYTEENTNVSRRNAKGNDSENLTAAQTIINSMPDVAVGIATPSAYALASAARGDVPVVFTAVSDPTAESADFSEFDNVTGSSDQLPVERQLQLIRDFFDAKGETGTITVAIVYTLSEANSVSQIAQFEAKESEFNVDIISRGITDATELAAAVDALIAEGADCFNNLTDNTVVQNLSTLLDRANGSNIPVFGSEIEQVEKGCIASVSLDYVELGRQTGYMIADILDGTKTADEIEFLYIEDGYTVDYNSTVMGPLGFTLPTGEAYTTANNVTAGVNAA